MKISHRSTLSWKRTMPGRLIVFVNTATHSSISTNGTS